MRNRSSSADGRCRGGERGQEQVPPPSGLLADLLASPRCVAEGWLSGAAVRSVWDEHQRGRRNWDYRLWGVLMLESWLDEHHR